MNHYKHVFRIFSFLFLVLAALFIARASLVPPSFGQYGSFRGAHLEEMLEQPVLYQGDDNCLECHEKEWDMVDGRHGQVPCEACHFSAKPHAEGEKRDIPTKDLALEVAKDSVDMAYKTIFAAMKEGWKTSDLDRLLEMLNHNEWGMVVRTFRGESVIRDYGEVEGEKEVIESDPDLRAALNEGKEILKTVDSDEAYRFIYPLEAEEPCLKCHKSAMLGEINGVLDITFPITRVQIRKFNKLSAMSIDRSRKHCQKCHMYMPSRPKYYPQVRDFEKHLKGGWKSSLGPLDLGAKCLTCHKAHFPRMVRKKEA